MLVCVNMALHGVLTAGQRLPSRSATWDQQLSLPVYISWLLSRLYHTLHHCYGQDGEKCKISFLSALAKMINYLFYFSIHQISGSLNVGVYSISEADQGSGFSNTEILLLWVCVCVCKHSLPWAWPNVKSGEAQHPCTAALGGRNSTSPLQASGKYKCMSFSWTNHRRSAVFCGYRFCKHSWNCRLY